MTTPRVDCITYPTEITIPSSLTAQAPYPFDDGYNIIPWVGEVPTTDLVALDQYWFKKCVGVGYVDGINNDFDGWKGDVWDNNDICITVLKNYIYSSTGKVTIDQNTNTPMNSDNTPDYRAFNPTRYQKAQQSVDYLLSRYYNVYKLTVPSLDTTSGYNGLQENFDRLCSSPESIPGICANSQTIMCNNCTRSNVSNVGATLRLCGCYVPRDPKFSTVSGQSTTVPPECDPMCVQEQISKKVVVTDNSATTKLSLLETIRCQSNVCVINNVSINAYQSSVQGVTFNQICPQCSLGAPSNTTGAPSSSTGTGSTCICVIDASIEGLGSKVGLSDVFSFNQYCGTQSVCLTIDSSTQEMTQVECASTLSTLKPTKYNFGIPNWVWIVAIFIIVIGLLICLSALYGGSNLVVKKPRLFISSSNYRPGMNSINFKS